MKTHKDILVDVKYKTYEKICIYNSKEISRNVRLFGDVEFIEYADFMARRLVLRLMVPGEIIDTSTEYYFENDWENFKYLVWKYANPLFKLLIKARLTKRPERQYREHTTAVIDPFVQIPDLRSVNIKID